MAWIESHQELARHPKTRRLSRALGDTVPAAIGYLHLLWWWALDYAQDGDLSSFEDADIADAAMWDGEAGMFVEALIACGFIEHDRHIHDWHEYAGRLLEKRAANAQRARNARVRSEHVAVLPNRTNRTEPNRTQPEERASAPEPPPPPEANPWDELEGERLDVFREWSRALNERLVLEDLGLAEDLVRIVSDHDPQKVREAVRRIRKRNDRPYPRQMLEALGVPQVVTNGRSRSREPDEYALPGYGGPT